MNNRYLKASGPARGWYRFDHCRRYLNHLLRLRRTNPGKVLQLCLSADLYSEYLRRVQDLEPSFAPIPILCKKCRGNKGHPCTFCYGWGSQSGATFAGGPVFNIGGNDCRGFLFMDHTAFGQKPRQHWPGKGSDRSESARKKA